ncbi:hypothetical protein Tco_0320049 [Tanacetum coccineum]
MMKRWPERFKRGGKLKRRRKGWMKKKLQRLHSLMSMISFSQDLMLTRYLLKSSRGREREMYTIEQRTKFLHDTIAAQRRLLAQQRSKAIRNKPPSRNQLRNQMMTYLKHVGGKNPSDLKTKSFDEIQVLYENIKRSDDSFISIGSAKDEKMIKEKNEQAANASKKRVKKDDTPDEDKEVDYEILDKKYPIIEWKSEYLTTKPQYDETEEVEDVYLNVVLEVIDEEDTYYFGFG